MTYLDFYHVDIMNKIRKAFVDFNNALADAEHSGEIEVNEVVVNFGTDKYCRVFYLDGECFVEPIYSPIRDIDDR